MRKVSRDHSQRRVLIADDESAVRQLLSRIVSDSMGCKIALASSGDEVLDMLTRDNFDVLLTDMVMPGLNGLDLIRAVHERWPNVDILVETGFPDAFPFVEVVHAGAKDFIAKPHHPQELEAKLTRLFIERSLRERLQLAQEKYRGLFQLSMDGNVALDQESLEVIEANAAFTVITGHSQQSVVGKSFYDFVKPTERSRFETAFKIFRSGGQGALGDVNFANANGEESLMDVSVSFIDVPDSKMILLQFKDVTIKRLEEEQFAEAAQTDAQTGLANKRSLTMKLENMLGEARRDSVPVSVLFIDLDNFKKCNDTYGHAAGDEVLALVGRVIRDSIRDSDAGFRYGGDEFAVLLRGASREIALQVAHRTRTAFEQANTYGTTLSVGIAEFSPEMLAADLLKAADGALYRAKSDGKNSVMVA